MFWQDNVQKQTMLWNNFSHFAARAPQCKKQTFFAPFLPPLICTQELLARKKCQTAPTMDILFVTIFATKFYITQKIGGGCLGQKCC